MFAGKVSIYSHLFIDIYFVFALFLDKNEFCENFKLAPKINYIKVERKNKNKQIKNANANNTCKNVFYFSINFILLISLFFSHTLCCI